MQNNSSNDFLKNYISLKGPFWGQKESFKKILGPILGLFCCYYSRLTWPDPKSREFEKNTNQNKLRPQDIDKIVDTFRKRKTIDKYSYLASYAEIEENEFNLNIPRYVDTFEEEEEIDIAGVQKEIEQIEAKLAETQKEMNKYLEELGF